MELINLVLDIFIVLAIVGLIWWLFDRYVPVPPPFKVVINVIIFLLLVVWLVRRSGLLAVIVGA